jgi:hypothetical protein
MFDPPCKKIGKRHARHRFLGKWSRCYFLRGRVFNEIIDSTLTMSAKEKPLSSRRGAGGDQRHLTEAGQQSIPIPKRGGWGHLLASA